MKNYKNRGLHFESEASITPGTIVLIGSEKDSPESAQSEDEPKALACWRVRINGCKQRHSAACRFGFDVERVECSPEDETAPPYAGAGTADQRRTNGILPERRKYIRRPYYRFVYFLCDEKYYEGVTKDISSGGLFIRTRGKLTVGMILQLSIPENPFEKERTIQAEVVRVEPGGIGVKILQILKNRTAAAGR